MTMLPALSLVVVSLITFLQPSPEDDPFAPDPAARSQAADRPGKPSGDDATAKEPIEEVAFNAAEMSPPILRLNPRGPQARSVAVAFSPDGKTLYAAGNDKVINVWRLGRTPDDEYQERASHFVPQPERTLRLPVGPGLWGTINALAVSDDGRWVAAAGWGWAEGNGMADFRATGLIWPNSAFFPETLEDIGSVFLFDLKTGGIKRLHGHQGPVIGLTFSRGKTTSLISLGLEQPPDGKLKGTARAWNLDSGQETGQIGLPKEPGERFAPAVAAWTLPNGTVRAAFTWSDGWVRVWDVDSKEKPRGFNAKLSMACVFDAGKNELLYGEFAGGVNRLVRRRLPLDAGDWQPVGGGIPFSDRVAPVAATIATFSGQRSGDCIAVALATATDAGPKYSLALRSSDDGRPIGKSVSLPFPATPALASSSLGYIAAASAADGSILIFKTSQLAAGDTRPVEQLDGIGRRIVNAVWVKNDDRQGLRFTDGRGKTQVLDLSDGAVGNDVSRWRDDVANAAAWVVKPTVQGEQTRLLITPPGGAPATATLPARNSVFAVCPRVAGIDRPILAAAASGSDDAGWLYLFDATTGERLRKLTGHTNGVTHLSFSKDGRLLASTSSDRTVNVWWLGDLGELVGQKGLLRGVNLAPKAGGGFSVKELTEEVTPAMRRLLPVGREVAGIVDDANGLQTFKTPGDLYRHIAERPAGSPLKLRTDAGDVNVSVGQAIDERKPLFSLFFESDPTSGRTSWIGWSPLGPFESSDRLVERLVGWHFNPLKANDPVRFADLGEYREAFFGRGLLDSLTRTGHVPEPWPPAEPKMSALFRDGNGQPVLPGEEQSILVAEVPAQLLVEMRGVPADRVEVVRWQADDGTPVPMTPSPDTRGLWMADLAGLQLAAGDHEFAFSADGRGFDAVEGRVTLRLRPVAAAAPRPPDLPRIVLVNPPADRQVIDADDGKSPAVKIEARVEAYRGPAPLTVEFLQNGEPLLKNDQPVRQALPPSDAPSLIAAEATLVPGVNRLEARLVGPNGPVGTAGPVVVTRRQPPVVTSLDVPSETEAASVTLTATVRSPTRPDPATLRLAINGVPVAPPVATIAAGSDAGIWNVMVPDVPLAKAANEISFRIANADGPSRQPRTANVSRVSPAPKPVAVEFVQLAPLTTLTTRRFDASIVVRAGAPLMQARLEVNDHAQTATVPAPTASGEYRFETSLDLNPGMNTIRFFATARDGGIGQAAVRVSVIERPVTIEVDRLLAADGSQLLPTVRDDGSVGVGGPVPSDLATLRGRIVWSAASEKPAEGSVYLHSWVNGFLQSSRRIVIAGEGLEQAFEMNVALNRRTGNIVRLELPAVAEEDGHRQIVLDCSDPNARQKVHLLTVGVGVPKAKRDEFTRSVVESLRGSDQATTDDNLVLYPALVGDVYAGDLLARLQLFRYRAPEPGSAHDVLLLYFRGREAAKPQNHFVLVTSDNSSDPTQDEAAVTSKLLSDLLEETRGAHLLFLDVVRFNEMAADPPPMWPRDSHLGVLRNVWLGDGPTPPEYSLATEFRQASRSERRLRRIADAIERNSRGRDTQMFDPFVPFDLTELVLLGSGGD